jgi:chromosome segregation protein
VEIHNQQIEELEDSKEKLSSLIEKEKQLRIELVSLQGKEEQLKNEEIRLWELITEIKNTQLEKEKESENSGTEIGEIADKLVEKEKELKGVFQKIEEEKANLNLKAEDQAKWQESLDAKEKELKVSRDAKEKVKEQLHQLKMGKVELSSQTTNIKNKVWEDYHVDLEKLEPYPPLKEEDMGTLKERVNALKEKLESMGPVNLLALEEFQSAKGRLDFLQNQVKDLTEAKQTLTSTIAKINNTAKVLFTQTFEQIKHNFQKVFEELFDGGETDLRLLEAADPLESPVLISARPYGKRLLNISQLSGGEKALTAIALLFAIYLVKPSPFCILDEVDAPLDDPNTTRFLKLIKHFSSNTQFIIITHNKLSMEAADIL